METKLFMIHPDRCTACHNCELACAMAHWLAGSTMTPGWPTTEPDAITRLSRIKVVADPAARPRMNTVLVCIQCDQAACMAACPAQALWRNPDTGAIEHKPERCIRCASCVAACPFGNMRWDTVGSLPIKCDLCHGDPVCVRFCPTAAIEYRECSDPSTGAIGSGVDRPNCAKE